MDQISFSAEQFAATAQSPSGKSAFLSPGEGFMQLWVFGILITLKVSGEETGGAFACQEALIPPQSRGPYAHYHTREDEFWRVTEGEVTWIVEGKELVAPTGSFIHIRRGVLHGFENRSEKFARMLVMFTPGKFQEWFIKVGVPAEDASVASFPGPVPTEEDMRQAHRWMETFGLGFTAHPANGQHCEDVQHGEL